MRKSLYLVLGAGILIVILINSLFKDPVFNTPEDQIKFAKQSEQFELAESCYLDLLKTRSNELDLNYEYISNHFDIPEKKKISKYDYKYRDDKTIKKHYLTKRRSNDTTEADIGNYGMGLCQVNLKEYNDALSYFKQVKNVNLKYLNNSIGNAYVHLEDLKTAEGYFRKEIALKGNVGGAYSNLVRLLFKEDRFEELDKLLESDQTKQYFSNGIIETIYFKEGKILRYLWAVFHTVFGGFNIYGFLGAFLIMGSWIMYLRKLDIYEPEKWRNIVLVCGFGMIFCFAVFPLSDINNNLFNFNLNGGVLNDFLYSVFGIGAIEELVKIIPLLFMLKFTKEVNEPFDYILYASVSALGFAFVENLEYFNENNLNIIHSRAIISVVHHMFNSSIIAYGMILNKYKTNGNSYLNFLTFWMIASVSHGFYDFWLINDTVNSFNIITFVYFLASMFIWNSFQNNALNHSVFFDKDKVIKADSLRDYLLYSLSSVFLFEYIVLSVKFGHSVGNGQLLSAVSSGVYLLVFLTTNLSKFSLVRNEWAPIRYWNTEQKIDYTSIVGERLEILPLSRNAEAKYYLPNKGKIIDRVTISGEPDWYLIKLEKEAAGGNYCKDQVLIRAKNTGEFLEKGEELYIAFYIIPDISLLENEEKKRTDFKFCLWAIAKL